MSTSGGAPKPRPPRRPPTTQSSVPPTEPDPVSEASGPSVFQPNPRRSTGGGSRSSKPTREPNFTGEEPGWWERIFYGGIGSGMLATFCRQLAAYLHAGVDYQKALTSLQLQFARSALGPVCGRLAMSVKKGEALTRGMAREPHAFDPLFLSMIRVAEERGGIPETLRILAKHYEARLRLIRHARSAMIYPIIVLVIAALVAAFFTIWLIPKLAEMLAELGVQGAELPLPSRLLMAFSKFVQSIGWVVIPVVVIGTPFLLFRFYKTAAGKRIIDRLGLRFPVFGPLLRKLDTSRFARALASLLDAGVDIGASLALAAEVVRLEPFRAALVDTRVMVLNGSDLSSALHSTRRFSHDVIAIVNSGEETGQLPESLNHLADDYEEQVEHTVKNLGQLVQPLLYIVLGGIVLFLILAVFLPYLSYITNMAKPH
jgi:type IV pilus assembly protein PilC